jgi:DNA processing protein
MLIRDGATLIRCAADVIEAVGTLPCAAPELPLRMPDHSQTPDRPQAPDRPPKPQRGLRETAALHNLILNRLGVSPMAEDQLIRDLGGAAPVVAPALVDLELEGLIARSAGGLLSRTN